jgi:hypothetical protein
MLIQIRCYADPTEGREKKITVYIDAAGGLHDVRVGWPGPEDKSPLGPILNITEAEWLRLLQIAQGVGL